MFNFIFAMISIYFIVNYKGDSKKKYLLYGTILGIVGGTLNSYVYKFMANTLPRLTDYVMSSLIYSLVITGGLILAEKTKLPTFFKESISKRKQIFVGISIGVLIGLYLYVTNTLAAESFLQDPHEGAVALVETFKRVQSPHIFSFVISTQAGVVEEAIFRLFMIPGIYFFLSQEGLSISRKNKLIISVLISALFFGLIPTHSFLLAFIMGIIMATVYLKYGFVAAVLVHILADIPNVYSLISILRNM